MTNKAPTLPPKIFEDDVHGNLGSVLIQATEIAGPVSDARTIVISLLRILARIENDDCPS